MSKSDNQRVIITDEEDRLAKLDSLEFPVSIEIEHHKVHEGDFYTLSDRFSGVLIVTPKAWLIRTPNTSMRFHCKMSLQSTSQAHAGFYENPTLFGSGTALTWYNNDRNSPNVTTMQGFKDPTVSGGQLGTQLQLFDLAAGLDKKVGGQARIPSEWILKQNEDYLLYVTVDANNASVSLDVEGYEVI